MYTYNANYTTYNNSNGFKRIFAIQFEDIDTYFTNINIPDLPSGSDQLVYLTNLPVLKGQNIDVLRGENRISSFNLSQIDISGQITQFIADNNIAIQNVKIWSGFEGLDFSDFEVIFRGELLKPQYNEKSESYSYIIGDKQNKLKKSLFRDKNSIYRGAGLLGSTIRPQIYDLFDLTVGNLTKTSIIASGTASQIELDGATNELNINTNEASLKTTNVTNYVIKFTSGSANGYHYQIDEVISYNNSLLKIYAEQVDYTGTYPSAGDTFEIFSVTSFDISGNMLQFLDYCMQHQLKMIDKTNYTSNPSLYDWYDYDDSSIQDIRTNNWSNADFKLFIDETIDDAKRFFEKEIYSVLQVFMIKETAGNLKLVITEQPTVGDTLIQFSDKGSTGNIIGQFKPEYKYERIINVVNYSYDKSGNDYNSKITYVNAESLTNYGEKQSYKLESAMIKTSENGELLIQSSKDEIFNRWSKPSPYVTFKALTKYDYLEESDIIEVESDNLPNLVTGTKDQIILMQIVNIDKDYENGYISITCFDTQFRGYARVIAPDTFNKTYAEATSQERAKYIWITDENGQVTDDLGQKVTIDNDIAQG